VAVKVNRGSLCRPIPCTTRYPSYPESLSARPWYLREAWRRNFLHSAKKSIIWRHPHVSKCGRYQFRFMLRVCKCRWTFNKHLHVSYVRRIHRKQNWLNICQQLSIPFLHFTAHFQLLTIYSFGITSVRRTPTDPSWQTDRQTERLIQEWTEWPPCSTHITGQNATQSSLHHHQGERTFVL